MPDCIHDLVALMIDSTSFKALVLSLPPWLTASGNDLKKVAIFNYKC